MITAAPPFSESAFRGHLNASIIQARTILENSKILVFPSDVSHRYEDKYLIVEFVVNSAISALMNCLFTLGLNNDSVAKLVDWAKTRSVTMRFSASDSRAFVRDVTQEVKSTTATVSTNSLTGEKTESYKITTETKSYFENEIKYSVFFFMGADASTESNIVKLLERYDDPEKD